MSSFNKENHKLSKARNIFPDPKRSRFWVVKNYDNDAKIVRRVELHDDLFRAIKPDGTVLGDYENLTTARVFALNLLTRVLPQSGYL